MFVFSTENATRCTYLISCDKKYKLFCYPAYLIKFPQ